jgi:hypothetical protein
LRRRTDAGLDGDSQSKHGLIGSRDVQTFMANDSVVHKAMDAVQA